MSNKLKRNVLKVATVGMTTVMAATPVTAYAAEIEPQGEAPETTGIPATQLVAPVEAVETTLATGATKLANEKLDTVEATARVKKEEDKTYAEGALQDAQTGIDTMKSENKAADDAEKANNELVAEINELASDTKGDLNQAADDFDEKKDAVADATTIDDAKKAASDAATIAGEAQKEFDASAASYADLVKKIETNNQVIKTAQENYDKALKESSEALDTALEELEAAKTVASQLETAAQEASTELANSGAAKIVALQKLRNEKDSSEQEFWTRSDQTFYEIIKSYYVPYVLNGTLVQADEKFTRPNAGTVGANLGSNYKANFYHVTYTDADGVLQHAYVNYKVEGNRLVIFTKEFIEDDVYRYVDDNGKQVEVNPTDANVVTLGDNKYFLADAGKKTDEIKVGDKETTENGTTEVTVVTELADTTAPEYRLENGQVVKSVKGEVTTVTTTGKSLEGSTTKYASKEAAEQAAKDAITVASGETLVVDSIDVTTSSETTNGVSYDAVFTATIDIVNWTTKVEWYEKARIGYWFASDETQQAKARTQFANNIKGLIEAYGYTVVGDIDTSNVQMEGHLFDGKLGKKTFIAKSNTIINITFKKTGLTADDVKTSNGADATDAANESATAAVNGYNVDETLLKVNGRRTENVTTSNKGTTYTYDYVDYDVTTSKTETKEVAKVTYATKDVVKEHVAGYYSNENYNNRKDLLLEASDKQFNDFINAYTESATMQSNVITQAQDAIKAVEEAEKRVNDLKQKLADLDSAAKAFDAEKIAKQAELETALAQAEADLTDAEQKLDHIVQGLADLADILTAKVASLTPADTEDEGETTVVTPSVEDTTTTPVSVATPAATPVAAQVAAPAANAANLVAVNPVQAPLAQLTLDDATDDTTDDAADEADEETQLQQMVEADDVESALADMTLDNEAKANTIIGWWWFLLVAILGGTGYTLYRKAQAKKATKKVDEK